MFWFQFSKRKDIMTIQLKQFLSVLSASHRMWLSPFRKKAEPLVKVVRCREIKENLQYQKAEEHLLTNIGQSVQIHWWREYRWWVERRKLWKKRESFKLIGKLPKSKRKEFWLWKLKNTESKILKPGELGFWSCWGVRERKKRGWQFPQWWKAKELLPR